MSMPARITHGDTNSTKFQRCERCVNSWNSCSTLYKLIPVSESLVINEIYLSLQGESTFAGLPCIFIRLTACNLRCSYCDTAYAFTQGTKKSIEMARSEVQSLA